MIAKTLIQIAIYIEWIIFLKNFYYGSLNQNHRIMKKRKCVYLAFFYERGGGGGEQKSAWIVFDFCGLF